MNTSLSKIIAAALFFICIFISGFWLSRSGKPYGALIFNLHKLIGLAAGIFLIVIVVMAHQAAALHPMEIAAMILTILFFTGLVAAGGLLSVFDSGGLTHASQPLRAAIQMVHHILPYLAFLSTAATFYLLFSRRL